MDKLLALEGNLKPEVKLGFALSEFSQALDPKYRKRFATLRGSPPDLLNPTEVIRVTEELNREGARSHRTWRPYPTRLYSFLHRIQIFASIGDVVIGGAQSLIASGVWCAVRVCLESSIGFLTYFDKLSAMLMNLGTSWGLHQDFASLFPRSKDLQEYTSSYVTSVVQLCKKVVTFAAGSIFKQFTASLTNSFDLEFGPLISELNQWGKLIEKRCHMLATERLIRADQGAVERTKALSSLVMSTSKEQHRFLLKQAVLRSLLPDQNHFETQWRRQRRKGTCPWLLEQTKYGEWKRKKQSCLLWIEGTIGSGKTVALANVVADVSLTQSCAYIFCTAKESQKARDMISCIAYHFIRKLPPEHPLWDQVISKEDAGLMSIVDIRELILETSRVEEQIFIIIDALEECDPEEVDDIFYFLKGLMEQRTVLMCFSCRPQSDCQKRFLRQTHSADQLYVFLHDASREAEIGYFIASEIERKTAGTNLDQDLKNFMINQLTTGAQGMYLWVSLQLDTLLPERPDTTTSVEDIRELLCHLPASLPEAFDQALSRIRNKRYGSAPFKLVTAAERPLDLDEFQVALTVEPGITKWDGSKLPGNSKAVVYECGGNLLEVDEEYQTVHFVHHSAMVHLLSSSFRDDTRTLHFSLQEAELYIGSVCVTLLHYGVFDRRVSRKTQNISSAETTRRLLSRQSENFHLLSHITRHIRSRSKAKPIADLDIGRVLYSMTTPSRNDSIVQCLFNYAHKNWLKHTSLLNPDNSTIWNLWGSVLDGELGHVQLPWNSTALPDLLDWGSKQTNNAIILYSLRKITLRRSDFVAIGLLASRDKWQLKAKPAWLNDILARSIYACQAMVLDAPVQILLDIGADPTVPHPIMKQIPLEVLVDLLPDHYDSRYSDLLSNFLNHRTVSRIHGTIPSDLVSTALKKGYTDIGLLMARQFSVPDVGRLILMDQLNAVDPKDLGPESSMALAVRDEQHGFVKKLLEQGLSPAASKLQDYNALQLALKLGHISIFKTLLLWTKLNDPEEFSAMRKDGRYGLMEEAIESNQSAIMGMLVDEGFWY